MDKNKYGVHITHCCSKHGCKYNDKDCPVVLGIVEQKYECIDCKIEYYTKILKDLILYLESDDCRYIRAFMKGKINNIEWCSEEELDFILTLNTLKKLL